ncbi:MAG: hypothetical protein ABIZ69_12890, partial [Ilumatobacteraceae bacterium]
TESVPATEATDEPTTVETVPASSSVVAGSPAGLTGDRAHPVPVGAVADLGSGWRMQILNVVLDGAATVAAANPFNDPPPDGSTFTLVTVALGYFGLEDPKLAFEPTISAVGAANVELTGECGIVPQQLDSFKDIFSGGIVIGNICFVTTPQDAASFEVYGSGDSFGGDDVFLDASSPPAGPVPMAGLSGPQPGAAATPGRLAPTPVGTIAAVGTGWSLTVTGAARDITDAVMSDNSFNSPPPDGFRFVGVELTYTYNGEGSASAYAVTAKAVGAANLGLSTDCGVTSGDVDLSADVFSGGSVSGTACFVAPADSLGFVMYATADFGAKSVMFATG